MSTWRRRYAPSVYATGVTIYHSDTCWEDYTLILASARSTARGDNLIDMNGHSIRREEGVFGCFDNKLGVELLRFHR